MHALHTTEPSGLTPTSCIMRPDDGAPGRRELCTPLRKMPAAQTAEASLSRMPDDTPAPSLLALPTSRFRTADRHDDLTAAHIGQGRATKAAVQRPEVASGVLTRPAPRPQPQIDWDTTPPSQSICHTGRGK
jgi:hypothetical protein